MLTTCCRREPCAGTREGISEASVAVRAVMMIEHRKGSFKVPRLSLRSKATPAVPNW